MPVRDFGAEVIFSGSMPANRKLAELGRKIDEAIPDGQELEVCARKPAVADEWYYNDSKLGYSQRSNTMI
eukprot:snap_masked-scaffold_34-processed-gene-0.31-mRNA-1 protein AED:1.00 eAED:1.00 QI:0/-1/0/0/-1/1/1/0/69